MISFYLSVVLVKLKASCHLHMYSYLWREGLYIFCTSFHRTCHLRKQIKCEIFFDAWTHLSLDEIMGFNSKTFMLFSKTFWIFWNLFLGAYFLIYLWTLNLSMNLFQAFLMHPSKCKNINNFFSSVWCAVLGNYLDFPITIFLLICIWKNCGVLKISNLFSNQFFAKLIIF
jgi:hypothetical protein